VLREHLAYFVARWYLLFIRRAFDLFYGEFAWTYDTVAWIVSRGLWRRWTLAALPYLRGRVLETGCGTGFVQYALARSQWSMAVGLDRSPQMLARTRQRAGRAGLEVRLTRAITQRLPFRPNCFDTVLATFPSDYLFAPETLREIRRVLAPSGRFVIVDAMWFLNDGIYERVVDTAYRLILRSSVKTPARAEKVDSPGGSGEPDGSALPRLPYQHLLEQAGFSCKLHTERVGPSMVMVMVLSPTTDEG
jgi:ubiquinone/menaquinone biosynthesis C-methylase UbiE